MNDFSWKQTDGNLKIPVPGSMLDSQEPKNSVSEGFSKYA
jgi:hypothetical protein